MGSHVTEVTSLEIPELPGSSGLAEGNIIAAICQKHNWVFAKGSQLGNVSKIDIWHHFCGVPSTMIEKVKIGTQCLGKVP